MSPQRPYQLECLSSREAATNFTSAKPCAAAPTGQRQPRHRQRRCARQQECTCRPGVHQRPGIRQTRNSARRRPVRPHCRRAERPAFDSPRVRASARGRKTCGPASPRPEVFWPKSAQTRSSRQSRASWRRRSSGGPSSPADGPGFTPQGGASACSTPANADRRRGRVGPPPAAPAGWFHLRRSSHVAVAGGAAPIGVNRQAALRSWPETCSAATIGILSSPVASLPCADLGSRQVSRGRRRRVRRPTRAFRAQGFGRTRGLRPAPGNSRVS